MIGLVSVSVLSLGIMKNLKRWQMNEFPMSLYFAEIHIFIMQNQRKSTINQCERQSFPDGAQRD